MWRFYLAATVIVAAFVFAVTLHKASPPDLRISALASGTPSAPRTQGSEESVPGEVRGDAPWALSALPDCARQHEERRGPAALVQRSIPPGAHAIEGTLHAGPCKIDVASDGITIVRGADRLRIPQPVRLLESGGRYYLYEEDRKGAVLRVYSFVK